MHIMTKNGWYQLSPQVFTPASKPIAYNGIPPAYTGLFPSQAFVDYHNEMQEKMKFFDTGVRMVYGRPDRKVEVDNLEAAHPIQYPPAGF